VGNQYALLWITIDSIDKVILDIHISLRELLLLLRDVYKRYDKKYGKHLVSTDGSGTWCHPQACKFLNMNHYLHSSYEKSMIERTIQCIKRIEPKALMTTFLVEKKNVNYNISEIGSIFLLIIIIRR
jgi:putative transposase